MRRLRHPSLLFLLAFPLLAQTDQNVQPALKVATAKLRVPSAETLHITHVSLYKNGVGYFEHEARVTGDASVRLDLTSAQMNDVLQSLTAIDLGGGHVTGANYHSTTPLEQQLRALPLSLGEQPSQEDLYAALRGTRVQVTGAGAPFTGRLLSLEVRPVVTAPADGQPAPDRRFATVVSDTGATRTLELGAHTVVRLLDTALREDLNSYLELLGSQRAEGIRHLVLTDHGVGQRRLDVSFLSEVPVWKATYRVLFTSGGETATGKAGTGTVQGFAVVDNTTGEDWNKVQLSLVAGSPQSFLQPISQPIYDRRPEVPIAANVQTTPQTHESGEGGAPPQGSASADLSSGVGTNPASLFGSPTGTGSAGGEMLSPTERIPKSIYMMKDTAPPPVPMVGPHAAAAPLPELYEQQARASNQVHATTAAFDDFFAYNLTEAVSIPRNGSALVPILQAKLPLQQVTLWSSGEPRPLRALWLKNTSGNTLDSGSFSVTENGVFAGEGLIDSVHPGERRLLSYAVDQAVHVLPEEEEASSYVDHLSVSAGVLRAETVEVAKRKYTVSDAAPEQRTVLLDEARRPGWTLDQTMVPAETTAGAYRFRLEVPGHGTAQLSVTQRRTVAQEFQLVHSSEEKLQAYLRDRHADPAALKQLEPLFATRRKLSGIDQQIGAVQSKLVALGNDQKRLRENLVALKQSTEERALAKRYTGELNTQENTLLSLYAELDRLQQQRLAVEAELTQRISTMHFG